MGTCMGDVREGCSGCVTGVCAPASCAYRRRCDARGNRRLARGGRAASAFSAHGSVEQVYVTGLAPSAQMSLLRSNGETVSTQTADSLGGLLFRNVAPARATGCG